MSFEKLELIFLFSIEVLCVISVVLVNLVDEKLVCVTSVIEEFRVTVADKEKVSDLITI